MCGHVQLFGRTDLKYHDTYVVKAIRNFKWSYDSFWCLLCGVRLLVNKPSGPYLL